jgi:hypothetical protein
LLFHQESAARSPVTVTFSQNDGFGLTLVNPARGAAPLPIGLITCPEAGGPSPGRIASAGGFSAGTDPLGYPQLIVEAGTY